MANIIEITDFEAPELDVFTRLTENQLLNRHEPEKGIFIAESPKVIERALAAGCRPAAFLAEKGRVRGETWRSWSGSRSFRFSQRSLRFSPK